MIAPAAPPAGQLAAPMLAALQANRARKMQAFSTPGHKGGLGADPDLVRLLGPQVFESDVWLNSSAFHHTLREAERLAAEAWDADRTFFLVEGSSCGNRAILLSQLGPGDGVLIGRDMHKSALSALVLNGASPVYVMPRVDPVHNVTTGYDPRDIDAALRANPKVRLALLVSPSYGGFASPLGAIAATTHAHGVPLVVDEAWGPHFHFHGALPESAIRAGADAAITSTHKILGALSQGSMMHVQGSRLDVLRLEQAVSMLQTTSPLLPILASLDTARRQMTIDGTLLLTRTIALATHARTRLRQMPGLAVIDDQALGLPPDRYDATRLLVDVRGLGISGFETEAILRSRFRIAPEMSDAMSVLFLITIGDTPDSITRLLHALESIASEHHGTEATRNPSHHACADVLAPGRQVMTPRQAFFAAQRTIPIASAIGEISAEVVTVYPPGIPILMPGEVIAQTRLDYLAACVRNGARITGATDPGLASIRIVAGSPAQ